MISDVSARIAWVVAVVGEKAAGKGEVTRIIRDGWGAHVLRLSDPIRAWDILERTKPVPARPELLVDTTLGFLGSASVAGDAFTAETYRRLGIEPPTTSLLQDIGNRLRVEFGPGFLTEVALRVSAALGRARLIIDGVRNPGELDALERLVPAQQVLLGVVSPLALRAKRFLEGRVRVGDPTTYDAFLALDRRDQGVGEPPHGQRVAACLARVSSDDMLVNEGALAHLEQKVRGRMDAHKYLVGFGT